ncbi:MAG: hypothetical protein MZW92_43100 [Comamonadaceae bacterium]|nr:hypothetical protein [Comamonadaceae bacterium]
MGAGADKRPAAAATTAPRRPPIIPLPGGPAALSRDALPRGRPGTSICYSSPSNDEGRELSAHAP